MKNVDNNSIYSHIPRLAELAVKIDFSWFIVHAKKLFLSSNQSTNAVTDVYLYDINTTPGLHHCYAPTPHPMTVQKEYIKQINTF